MSFFGLFEKSKKAEIQLWEDDISIYQHISDNLDSQSGRLKESAYKLPDDERRFKPTDLRWVAGGMDGAFGHHSGGQDLEQADEIANLLHNFAKSGSRNSEQRIYNILLNDSLVGYIDTALEKAVELGISPEPYLHGFANLLTTRSPDRGPVKFGIAILGLIRDPADLAIIKLLGKHEEFTLFSAVAISNLAKNPEVELFELAKTVDGWGKIHLVERLAQTKDPAIKYWLIRDGYKNNIMYEYLVYSCAVGGDLHQELANRSIDEKLFDSAGDIIKALICGGPAEDIRKYEHAAELISAYLKHFGSFPKKLDHFLVLRSVYTYLSDEDWDNTAATKNGWSEELRGRVLESIQHLSDQSEWIELVNQGLSSSDQQIFYNADRAARHFGIDTWRVHWTRLQSEPMNASNWYFVMSLANDARIDEIVAFATKILPLDKIATGPAEERGFGPIFKVHSCLDFILQDLKRYPGKGESLILAGLASPVIRNRNMALKALSSWGLDDRSDKLNCALAEALSAEPSDDVRNRIQKVLHGERIE